MSSSIGSKIPQPALRKQISCTVSDQLQSVCRRRGIGNILFCCVVAVVVFSLCCSHSCLFVCLLCVRSV